MKVNDEDKKIYTDDEIINMFQNIPLITNNLRVGEQLYNNYKNKKTNSNQSSVEQRSTDNECPVCLDELENGIELVYCKSSCGNSIHKLCFEMWDKAQYETRCVFCRAVWMPNIDETTLNLLH